MRRLFFYLFVALFVVGCSSGGDDNDTPTPNQSPVAEISINATEGTASFAVMVNASDSTDSDGTISSYEWDFGDDATATGVTAEHTYESTGEYTITLRIEDNDGATDEASVVVSVSEATVANEPPTATFSLTPATGLAPLEVTFDASASSDSDGSISSYAWDFGDSTTGSGATTTHTYTDAGEYTVTLTVADDDGASASSTAVVSVSEPSEPDPEPNADFTGTWAWVGQFELTGIQFVGFVEYSTPLDDTDERRDVQTGPWLFCATNINLCPSSPSGIGLIGELISEGEFELFVSFAESANEIRLIAFDDDNAIGADDDGDPFFFGRGIWTFDTGLQSNMFLGMTKLENADVFSIERLKEVVSQTEVKQGTPQAEQMKQILDAVQDAF